MPETADEKQMLLRYAAVCRVCGVELPARVEAIYERPSKTVRCVGCSPVEPSPTDPEPMDIGTPGASARREFDRRQGRREARIREKHPRIGGFILAISDEPQSTAAWNTGALGEERLGEKLNELASETVCLLHDRRIPGTKANIDHVAVTPTGLYVIDAKRYKGRPNLKVDGGIFRPRVEKLMVGSRDQTKLVDGVLKQVDVVRTIVGDDIPVTGVLCFIEADWPLIGGSFTTRGVDVLWPKKLYPRIKSDGPHGADVAALHHTLATALPKA